MSCTGRYAQAFDFILQWCIERMLSGFDNGGWTNNLYITDTTQYFLTTQRIPVGSPVYNATKLTYGRVTAVTDTILQTTNLWSDGDNWQLIPSSPAEVATIEHALDMAAADIQAAMSASGQCDCALAGWAANFLMRLNVVGAAIFHNCSCGDTALTIDTRQQYIRWLSEQLTMIRTSKIELCEGYTGADFPAAGWVERSWTIENEAQIIMNRLKRTP